MRKLIVTISLVLLFIELGTVSALSVSVLIPEKYAEVVAGERFYFEIEIKYPENVGREDLRLEYDIENQEGETIAQSQVLKAVETQASFIDSITLPENTDKGLHLINVMLSDYSDLSEEVSASFFIISPKSQRIQIYFYVLLGATITVGGLVIFNIILIRRRRRRLKYS